MTEEELLELERDVQEALDDVENGRVHALEESKALCWKVIQETIEGLKNAA